MFEMLISQAIERNEVVIVIDPKGDNSLKSKLRYICEASCREDDFSVLDLKTLENTTRSFDLFASNPTPSAIADRLCTLMKKNSNDHDPFADYAYDAIRASVISTMTLALPVTLVNIKRNISQTSFFNALLNQLAEATVKSGDKKSALYYVRLLKGFGVSVKSQQELYNLADIDYEYYKDGSSNREIIEDVMTNLGCEMSLSKLESINTCVDELDSSETVKAGLESLNHNTDDKLSNESDGYQDSLKNNRNGNNAKFCSDCSSRADHGTDTRECEDDDPSSQGKESKLNSDSISSSDAPQFEESTQRTSKASRKGTVSKSTTRKRTTRKKALSISAKVQILANYYEYFLSNTKERFDQDIDLLLRQSCLNPDYYLKITAGIGPILNVLSNDGVENVLCASSNDLSFRELYIKNKVFYCCVPSMSSSSLTKYVGRLLLSDLSSFASNINAQEKIKNDNNADNTECSVRSTYGSAPKIVKDSDNRSCTLCDIANIHADNKLNTSDSLQRITDDYSAQCNENSSLINDSRGDCISDKAEILTDDLSENVKDRGDRGDRGGRRDCIRISNNEGAYSREDCDISRAGKLSTQDNDCTYEPYDRDKIYSDNYLNSLTANLCPSVVLKIIKEQDCLRKEKYCNDYKEHDLKPIKHNNTDYLKLPIRRRVNIFIDEASEIVNEPLLQLLNKSRSAGFAITIATQTFADLATRCGSPAAAKQLIGNCNTVISLRVGDNDTASVISSALPTTTYQSYNTVIGTNADSQTDSVKDTQNRSSSSSEDTIFPPSVMLNLPNFEYVAKLSDGRFVKGIIPYLAEVS
ncbi:MAG: TraM recognition domain-containing protein [Succinivibrio sp.]